MLAHSLESLKKDSPGWLRRLNSICLIFLIFFSLSAAWNKLTKFFSLLEEKWMIHILLHYSLSTFCFFFGGIIWIHMKSKILGSKTVNQNVHAQKFSPNAKIFKECSLIRTSIILTTLFLQTTNKDGGGVRLRFDFIWIFLKCSDCIRRSCSPQLNILLLKNFKLSKDALTWNVLA